MLIGFNASTSREEGAAFTERVLPYLAICKSKSLFLQCVIQYRTLHSDFKQGLDNRRLGSTHHEKSLNLCKPKTL